GVVIRNGAQMNRIGSDGGALGDTSERNIISNNGQDSTAVPGSGSVPLYGTDGVAIFDAGTNENVVAGNFIGADKTGFLKESNSGRGVAIYNGAQKNRIGAHADATDPAMEVNVISNNASDGVAIYGVASDGTGTNENLVA